MPYLHALVSRPYGRALHFHDCEECFALCID